jgi:hypothetical protein
LFIGFGVSDRGLGESHRTRHEKADMPNTGLMYWRMCPLGLDLSVFRGDAAKVKERLFSGRKKMDLFSEIHFLMLGAGNETRIWRPTH